MKIRSYEELVAGDERSRRFAPGGGLDTARIYDVRVTAELMQSSVQSIQLVEGVADVVRDRFEVLRLLHVYGAFAYEFFGVAITQAHLLYETALGARFVDAYGGKIPLVRRRTGETAILEVTRFSELHDALRRGRYRHWARATNQDGWHVVGLPAFDCSLAALLQWAYGSGLLKAWLDGRWARAYGPTRVMAQTSDQDKLPKGYWEWDDSRRDAWWENEKRAAWDKENLERFAQFRNYLAHPHETGLTLPTSSRSSLEELADFVNSLWTSTPIAPARIEETPPLNEWLVQILNDVRQVLVQRFIWRSVTKLVAANPQIHEDDTFYRWMSEVYAIAAAAAVRRQIDKRADSVSLLRLLEAMAAHPEFASRERHVGRFMQDAPPPERARPYELEALRHASNGAFDRLAGAGADHYDPSGDIARLLDAAAPVKQYVNEHVAHPAEQRHEPAATYAQLDRALDMIDELVRKVHVLLTGDDLVSVVPVWQYDWMTIFDTPWRVQKTRPR